MLLFVSSLLVAAASVARASLTCSTTATATTSALIPPPPDAVCGDDYQGKFTTKVHPYTSTQYSSATDMDNFSACRALCLGDSKCGGFGYGRPTIAVTQGVSSADCLLFTGIPTGSFTRKTSIPPTAKSASYYYSSACFSSTCNPVPTTTSTATPANPPVQTVTNTVTFTLSSTATLTSASTTTVTDTVVPTCGIVTTAIVPPPVGPICGSQGTPSASFATNTHHVSITAIPGGSFDQCRNIALNGGQNGQSYTAFGYNTGVGQDGTTTVTCSIFKDNYIFTSFHYDHEGAGGGTYYYNTRCFGSGTSCTPTKTLQTSTTLPPVTQTTTTDVVVSTAQATFTYTQTIVTTTTVSIV